MRGGSLDPVDWDSRYRSGFYTDAADAHGLLKRFSRLLPSGGKIVDIAMGNGRDLLFLAEKGFECFGLERSGEALKIAGRGASDRRLSLMMVMGDARYLPFRRRSFDGLLLFYFLDRPAIDELIELLRPGGLFIYETFLKRQNLIDRPRNPDYLLDDAELLSLLEGLELLFYEEGIFLSKGKQRALARYVGRKQ
jgi:tellurite methyltransferase